MVEVFSQLKTELLMKGYIYLWCFKCKETTLHIPLKARKPFAPKTTKYECIQCGELTQRSKSVKKKKSTQKAWMQNRSKKGRFGKKLSN